MSAGIQAAEQTVHLAVRPGGEIKRVGRPSIAVGAAAAERDGPQPVDEDRLPLGVAHLAKKLAALRIEGVDTTVAKISDPQGAAQNRGAFSCSTEKSWLHFRPPPVDFCGSRLAIGAATERARAPPTAR